MLTILKNVPLAPYTTLKIGQAAEFFAVIRSLEDLREAISWAKENKQKIFIIGGGSNILISKKVKGLVLKNEIKGMEVIEREEDYALVEAKSGEAWTKFVNYTVERDLYGLENLFLIYGTVGAAPVQNIGAYGVELKDSFYHLKAVDLKTGHEKIFSASDCKFGYRDSIFKNRLKGKYFIYSVTLKLKREADYKLDYGSIREELLKKGISKPYLQDIVRVITQIRNNKLPNPGVLPNAGSFFKNAEVSLRKLHGLQKKYPNIPNFPAGKLLAKIPTGWLIEQAGYKGKVVGPVSMYERQALILVNHGGAEAKHVLSLVKKVKAAVKKKFGIEINEEVNVI
ncbi:MAG: UDP-N-acetylmuramate dehydrogenase [Candidatus Falkowbacteria bacterium]